MNDFELNVRKMVRQFNLQARQVEVAARTDETARRRYEVALRLYLMGKSTVLDLNAAISEKGYGTAQLHRSDENLLDALLRFAQHDAIRLRA